MILHAYEIIFVVYDIPCDFISFLDPDWAGSNAAPAPGPAQKQSLVQMHPCSN